ncbi:Mu transposase C-terminal domain-containing protein [Aliiroseovarius sp. M344]|uniref:Mu transposase C-terminal domain-containing protein n=1 Tax=Aliiroseovarius sp. M344 TaxID=2867010 RepID=UPI0021AD8766|nr:Mu transposase C-terminal domain-containing protein [Aliiroseovarius sp. M344]UWQ14144.1 Mu transposase C-terminal domain-containing protein [Aliiroseovarius sp. M344]
MIFNYDPADTFIIFGVAHWCSFQNDKLCIFEPKEKGSGPPKTLTRKEINFLRGSNNWRYLPGPRARERLNRAVKSGSKALRDAHPNDRDAAIFTYMECMNLEFFRNAGAIVLTPTSLKENWNDILGVFLAQEAVRNIDGGPRRGGSKLPQQRKPHAPETLLKLYKKLRKNKYDPGVLVPKYRTGKEKSLGFCADTEQFIRKFVRASINLEDPKDNVIAKDTRDALIEENKLRARNGEKLLGVPCERTIIRRIGLLDPFEVSVLRDGIDHARNKHSVSSGGLDLLYALERVEIDEWEGDVRVKFQQLGIWNELPEDIRKDMPVDGRRWIYVAIDCASRCILGLSVCSQPNSDAARRILAQILTDKTELARAAGAEGSWDFFGSPHLICTDTGSAFSSNMFILSVNTLGAIMLFPPVKIPELRSRIERAFGTMARKIMPLLPGRTFNSPIVRGDYPSEERTVLTDEDLTRILTVWVVDHYHHQPHRGLPGGQSPASRWKELVEAYDVSEPPDLHTRRVALGYEYVRTPSKQGVVLFSNHYDCKELMKFRRSNKGKPVRIRIDPDNIGAVSVEIDRVWYDAPALNGEELEGLSMAHWSRVMRELRQKYAAEAELTLPQRNRAIQKIRKLVDEARELGGLIDPEYTAARLEYLEDNLCAGMLFHHPETPPIGDGDVPFGKKIEPLHPTGPENTTQQSKQNKPTDGDEPEWTLED